MTNLDWIVSGTLIGAVAFVSICALVNRVPSRIPLGKRVGPVNFDFSKSFASTITALGALLATVLASKGVVVISHRHLDSVSYAALSLFFGILVVIAPIHAPGSQRHYGCQERQRSLRHPIPRMCREFPAFNSPDRLGSAWTAGHTVLFAHRYSAVDGL